MIFQRKAVQHERKHVNFSTVHITQSSIYVSSEAVLEHSRDDMQATINARHALTSKGGLARPSRLTTPLVPLLSVLVPAASIGSLGRRL